MSTERGFRVTGGPVQIKRDGEVVACVGSETEAFQWLHANQGQSVYWALNHGGYAVFDSAGRELLTRYRDSK